MCSTFIIVNEILMCKQYSRFTEPEQGKHKPGAVCSGRCRRNSAGLMIVTWILRAIAGRPLRPRLRGEKRR